MEYRRKFALLAAGLLLVGCGSQVTGTRHAETAMEPGKFFSLLSEEPCPPEPCTDCTALGSGIFFGTTQAESYTFGFQPSVTPPSLNVSLTHVEGAVVTTFAGTGLVTRCETVSGRDTVTISGSATRTQGANVENGTFVAVASVDAGSGNDNPRFTYSFDGTTVFDTADPTLSQFNNIIAIDNTPCELPTE